MVKLTNPLTIEERLTTTRLIKHECKSLIGTSMLNVNHSIEKQVPIKEPVGFFINYTYQVLDVLSKIDEDTFSPKDNPYSFSRMITDAQNLCKNIHKHGLKINNTENNLATLYPFMNVMLWNLIKNSAKMGIPNISIEPSDFPSSPTLIPEGARDYKEFIAFRVHDNGKGFPQDKNWSEYFTRCPPKGEHGFGLYFTGLVAKVLRAPVEIQSVPGDTTVSFYHPVYEKD